MALEGAKKEGDNVVNADGTAAAAPGGVDVSKPAPSFTPGQDAARQQSDEAAASAAKPAPAPTNDTPAPNKKKCCNIL